MSNLTAEYREIVMKEPYITENVRKVASDFNVPLAGLKFRLKSWHSAVEKVRERTHQGSFKRINDMVRYTMIVPEETFGKSVNTLLAGFASYGIYVKTIRNFWTRDDVGYNGVNVTCRCKGMLIEIQFHTRDSYNVKETQNHDLYERYRKVNKDSLEAELINEQMIQIGRCQRKPVGYEEIRNVNDEEEFMVV